MVGGRGSLGAISSDCIIRADGVKGRRSFLIDEVENLTGASRYVYNIDPGGWWKDPTEPSVKDRVTTACTAGYVKLVIPHRASEKRQALVHTELLIGDIWTTRIDPIIFLVSDRKSISNSSQTAAKYLSIQLFF